MEAADIACANAGCGLAGSFARKVVIERDGAEKFGKRDAESFGDCLDGVVGQVAITIVKGVEQRKEGRWLIFPAFNEGLIGLT